MIITVSFRTHAFYILALFPKKKNEVQVGLPYLCCNKRTVMIQSAVFQERHQRALCRKDKNIWINFPWV